MIWRQVVKQANDLDNLRERVFLKLSIFLGLVAIPLAALNYYLGDMALALIQLTYTFTALVTWRIFDRFQTKRSLIRTHILILCAVILLSIITKPINEGVFQWSICLPAIFFFLLDKNEGVTYSLLYLVIKIIALMFIWEPEIQISVVNFVLSYLLTASVCFTYESKRTSYQKDWKKLAHFDFLTGALNRRALDCHLSEIQKNEVDVPAVVSFDIDNFKQINDRHGHDGGDQVLIELTKRLQKFCGEQYVYRVGGEEFVVALSRELLAYSGSVKSAAESILRCVSIHPVCHNEKSIFVTVSGGLVTRDNFDTGMWSVLDENLYMAKKHGKSRIYKDKNLLALFE
ncbi:GGDEF domain-containing protein [Vibrio nigripulchritudo]|uniref:GGDEF domain-containing protein n=1 Tax=Vibrio nigripulchritudo TaxID=28173 RepID=UPI0009B633B0|nr:GGDEF domain-containing protein [Vibrio nigripulchritudo]